MKLLKLTKQCKTEGKCKLQLIIVESKTYRWINMSLLDKKLLIIKLKFLNEKMVIERNF